jgi:arylsulfatase A-like enzyme
MLGQRSIYHKGWLACSVHPPPSGWGEFDQDVWELYDLEHDRANLAEQEPVRLETLKSLVLQRGPLQPTTPGRPDRPR